PCASTRPRSLCPLTEVAKTSKAYEVWLSTSSVGPWPDLGANHSTSLRSGARSNFSGPASAALRLASGTDSDAAAAHCKGRVDASGRNETLGTMLFMLTASV